jgi:hypothetical protein
MAEHRRPKDVHTYKRAAKKIKEKAVEVFCDHLGQPCIHFITGSNPGIYLLRHSRTRSWLSFLCYETTGELLGDRATERVLDMLESVAWERGLREPADGELLRLLEHEPVLQVIAELAREKFPRPHTSLMTDLLKELARKAVELGVPTSSKRWPKSGAALSFKIVMYKSTLTTRLGIQIKGPTHTHEGSEVTLTYVMPRTEGDAGEEGASPGSSPATTGPTKDLQSESDALKARLRSMKGE